MSKRENIKTTIKEAVDYWSRWIDESGLSVDWAEAESHCWRCGCEKNLQRCHIVPDSLGGKDEPANIVLLCKRCHAEGQNVTDPEIMWDWIRAYGVAFYETFWNIMGLKEYKFIYKKSVVIEIKEIVEKAGRTLDDVQISEWIKENLKLMQKEASIHYGQPYYNNATIAGMHRMLLKRLAAFLGVEFPVRDEAETDKIGVPWWADV